MSSITFGAGITVGAGITADTGIPVGGLLIPTNDLGGLVGWGPYDTAAGIPYSATIIAQYPVGSTITFQDGSTATITQWDPYAPTYIDIFWDTPKSGTIFPITLST
jgi:hypothetical protein